jgi:RimJ/RimL family protein N-acetyltransferase
MNNSNQPFLIREALPGDAAGLIAYVRALADEPGIHLELSPGEFNYTIDQERQFLAEYAKAENSIFLIADAAGTIAGNLNLHGGRRQANRHVATLGMAVTKGWRNKGVGNQLLQHAITWAGQNPIVKKVELNVFVENAVAVHLYKKYGFLIEGTRKKAVFRDGRFHDNYFMALML